MLESWSQVVELGQVILIPLETVASQPRGFWVWWFVDVCVLLCLGLFAATELLGLSLLESFLDLRLAYLIGHLKSRRSGFSTSTLAQRFSPWLRLLGSLEEARWAFPGRFETRPLCFVVSCCFEIPSLEWLMFVSPGCCRMCSLFGCLCCKLAAGTAPLGKRHHRTFWEHM